MINVKSKPCLHNGCKVIPYFNFKGERQGLYCKEHKKDGMINVKSKPCLHNGCKVRPTFNFEWGKHPLYCQQHKKDGMIDVKNKTCLHNNCKIRPNFNFEGKKTPLYCKEHKKDGMIDVKNKTCLHNNCKIQPNFNFEGETLGLYCQQHKKDGMIDVKNKHCKSPLCDTQITNKYKGYCVNCFIHLFPNEPVSRNYKTKEIYVRDYILDKFKNFTWVCDKKVENGCSGRRPDLLLDLGYQVIVVEVDENQHLDYDSSCENKRLMEISQDLNHRPLIFIRFNPDDYTKGDKKITSCWGINGKGICVVKKSKKVEWENRLKSLSQEIEYWSDPMNKIDKTIEVIQLFYDD
jgi:hypothetical protein